MHCLKNNNKIKMSCQACNKSVNRKNELKVNCYKCKTFFHANCVNLLHNDVSYYNENNNFLCKTCDKEKKVNDRSVGINTSVLENSRYVERSDLNEIGTSQLYDILMSLETKLNEINLKLDNSTADISSRIDRIEQKFTQIEILEKENKQLRNELNLCQQNLDSLEYLVKKDCLEFYGIPEIENETLNSSVLKVLNNLVKPIESDNIIECYRTNKSTAIVRFNNISIKEKIIKEKIKNKKELFVNNIFGLNEKENKQIFLNECMSNFQKSLMYRAKKINYEQGKKYKYIWFSYGLIKLRKSDNDRVTFLRTETDLINIFTPDNNNK